MNITLHVRSRSQSDNITSLITFYCKDNDGYNYLISVDYELSGHRRLYTLLATFEYLSIEIDETAEKKISDERINVKGHFYKRIPPGCIDTRRSKEITCDQFYTDGWGGI